MKRWPLLLTLVFFPLFAHSQTATVSGNLYLPPGTAAQNSMMRMQLVYCGGNSGRVPAPPGSGTPATIISFLPFDVHVDNAGHWTTALYGNDAIICGTDLSGGSRWRMKPIFNGVSGAAVDYQVESGTSFSPDTALQCSVTRTTNCAVNYPYTTPPPPPVQGPPGPPGPAGPPGSAGGGVNSGTATHLALYPVNGTTVGPSAGATDDGATLGYTGDTYVAGTSTVDNQVLIAGAYLVDSPIPGSPMAAAPDASHTDFGVSSDGWLYESANGLPIAKICTSGDATCGVNATINGQTLTPGGTVNVNAGAANHSLALNQGSGNAIAGLPLLANQIAVGRSAILDPVASTIPTCPNGLAFSGSLPLTCVASGKADQGSGIFTINVDVPVSASTDTTWLTKTVTMPSSGCPCRVFLSYGVYYAATDSVAFFAWVDDSINGPIGSAQGNQSGSASGGSGLNGSSFTKTTYTNSTAVVFRARVWTTGTTMIVKAGPAHASGGVWQNSWLNIVIFTSTGTAIP